MIRRLSTRTHKLDERFLHAALSGAHAYDRIAGYFSSGILEVAGEAIENLTGQVRVICNSDLHPLDVQSARAAALALKGEWTRTIDPRIPTAGKDRFARLYELLKSGKMDVRVLPTEAFGLMHGKAGVITRANGTKTAFMGSVNETWNAWKVNYEMLWEDDSADAVQWVEAEFRALWNDPRIVKLSDAVVQDIARIAARTVVSLPTWKADGDPAAAVIESPVYRKEYGLWAHQKYFVDLAYRAHVHGRGARYVLADMVGLGKTVQLALAAQLMALAGEKPVLIIVPKTLLWQWQAEMHDLLDMPSAVWDGKNWIDEAGLEHPSVGPQSVGNCPRRVGIVSQGIITRRSAAADYLLRGEYECVVVDECHRARRRNLKKDGEAEPAQPNNLLAFLHQLAARTKSMLLGTATPVQLQPIEAYDLLDILNIGHEGVLGNAQSPWRRLGEKRSNLLLSNGAENPPTDLDTLWAYVRNPLPAAEEDDKLFGRIRRELEMPDAVHIAEGKKLGKLGPATQQRILRSARDFFQNHNPFIRHIIRRTRDFLENEIDPSTGETYLKKVEVELFGEDADEAVILPGYLEAAYASAEEFCRLLGERMRSAGFMKMMLLKRIGSSLEAGRRTATKILTGTAIDEGAEEDDESIREVEETAEHLLKSNEASTLTQTLTLQEKEVLERLIQQLATYTDRDPKYEKLRSLLTAGVRGDSTPWMELGCIIFSQYYDTALYMARTLSADLRDVEIGLYAGGSKAGIFLAEVFTPMAKEDMKKLVQAGHLKILFGTDAASEGLNLQRLSTLINIDLPWNPTRLEQRKGRIQRIGQVRDKVYLYNMRYRGSVEDRVHALLSSRLAHIHQMFGQLPDVLEDAWIEVALGRVHKAREVINAVPREHPFEMKYNRVENVDWETYSRVLNKDEKREALMTRW